MTVAIGGGRTHGIRTRLRNRIDTVGEQEIVLSICMEQKKPLTFMRVRVGLSAVEREDRKNKNPPDHRPVSGSQEGSLQIDRSDDVDQIARCRYTGAGEQGQKD